MSETTEHVDTEILRPMQAIFLPPRQNMDSGALLEALRAYTIALRGYSAADLRTAWLEVIAAHTSRSWPVPAVIVTAVKRVLIERGGDIRSERARQQRQDNSRRWNTWISAKSHQIARDAAEAGCSWSLKCAILNDGKNIGEISLAELIRQHASAEEVAQAIDDCAPIQHNGRWIKFEAGDNRDLALQMHRTLQVREAETAAEIQRGLAA